MDAISARLIYTSSIPIVKAMKPQNRRAVPPSVRTKVKTLSPLSVMAAERYRVAWCYLRKEDLPADNDSRGEPNHGDELEISLRLSAHIRTNGFH